MKIIYLDNNATTKIDEKVFEAMLPYLKEEYFNPSSLYAPSKAVKKRISSARQSVATLLNCDANEVVFTSGGSESNVMAIMELLKSIPAKKIADAFDKDTRYRKIEETDDAVMKKYKVKELPTLLFFKKGKFVGKIEGYVDDEKEDQLLEKVKKFAKK